VRAKSLQRNLDSFPNYITLTLFDLAGFGFYQTLFINFFTKILRSSFGRSDTSSGILLTQHFTWHELCKERNKIKNQ